MGLEVHGHRLLHLLRVVICILGMEMKWTREWQGIITAGTRTIKCAIGFSPEVIWIEAAKLATHASHKNAVQSGPKLMVS